MITKASKSITIKALEYYLDDLQKVINAKSESLKKDGLSTDKVMEQLEPLRKEQRYASDAKTEIDYMDVIEESEEYTNKFVSTKVENLSFSELERKHPEQLKHIALTNPAMYKRLFKEQYGHDVSDSEMEEVNLAYGGNGKIVNSASSYVSLEEKTRAIKELGDSALMSQLAKKDPNSVRNKIELAFPGMKESDKNEFINTMINL